VVLKQHVNKQVDMMAVMFPRGNWRNKYRSKNNARYGRIGGIVEATGRGGKWMKNGGQCAMGVLR
jgi:hypothetical protein